MPTLQQLPPAAAVNSTDEIMLDQSGTSVVATVGQLLQALPVGQGLVYAGGTLAADTTVLAPLASAALTGTPSAPTPAAGDASTRLATTAFVGAAVAGNTITLAGDVSGSGTGTIDVTLDSVATPGVYGQVTVNAKGLVTAGGALTAADVDAALGYPPLAGNQTITLSGDVSGAGATAIVATLPSVVAAGTYERVTVDAKGRVLAGDLLVAADIDAVLGYTPLAGNQTITLSGDVAGAGTTAITATLPAVVTPGTYEKVSVDAKGRVLAGAMLSAGDVGAALGYSAANAADLSADPVTASGGSAARTLAARAADRINVLDYGADPSGVADSAPAFAAAMAQVVSGGWGQVRVPRGSYHLASAVNQPSGKSVAVIFDDGADLTGPGYLGVDRVEATQGPFSQWQNSGGWFGFAPVPGDAANPGFRTEFVFNTPQNSNSMRVGWDRRYTNTNIYGKVHSGIDIAEQRIHSWPNLYDNSSGWGLWEVINGTTLDEDSIARAGLSSSCEISETDVVNNGPEAGWTWRSGLGNTVQGMSIDPWGQNGSYGGHLLFNYGSVGGYDGNVAGINERWVNYPAVFSVGNPPPVAQAATVVISLTLNGVTEGPTTVTLNPTGTAGDLASAAAAINAAAIANVRAAVTVWGGVVSRLVIFAAAASDLGTLTLGGTALAQLGIGAGSYATPRGSYAVVIGGSGSVAVGDKLVLNGTTITVGGQGAASDVAAAINAATLPGIHSDTNASGNLVITAFMPQNAVGLVLANPSGYSTLTKLGIGAGTFLPPVPPKGFATAYGELTTPICLPTDQISISATDLAGTVHGPVTVTLNGGDGSAWPIPVATSIIAALTAAGIYSADFTALSSGSAVVAVRAVGGGANQGVYIRNTAGGTLTLADAHGAPLETLGITPGTYQPGGYSPAAQSVFMAAEDSIAPQGRGIFLGGASNASDIVAWPNAPLEARGSFLHGLRLDHATINDGNAVMMAANHAIAWGSKAQGQTVLGVSAGTLEVNGTPVAMASAVPAGIAGALLTATGTVGAAALVSTSAALDAAFGSEYGDTLYRGAAGWVVLTPGSTGQALVCGGAGAAPGWTTVIPAGAHGMDGEVLMASGTLGVASSLPLGAGLATLGGVLGVQPAGTAALGGVIAGSGVTVNAGGTISVATGLAAIGADMLLGNATGAGAVPGGVPISANLSLTAGTLDLASAITVGTPASKISFSQAQDLGGYHPVVLTASGTSGNVPFVLAPGGVGYLATALSDGSAANGIQRGQYAVDWQQLRSAATQVASGGGSVLLGGEHNTASGNFSVAAGYQSTAGNSYAVALGYSCVAVGLGSVVLGQNASDRGGAAKLVFAGNGAQGQQFAASTLQATSIAAATRMTADGLAPSSSNSLPLSLNHVVGGVLTVTGRNVSTGDGALWSIPVLARNVAGTVAVTSPGTAAIAPTAADSTLATATVSIGADNINKGLAVTVTPPAGVTMSASASFVTAEM